MNDITETIPRNLETALRYARGGYAVLRVHGVYDDGTCRCRKGRECAAPGKHPVGRKGVNEATTDEAVIRRWFATQRDYNLAIATGNASGIVAVDVDPRNGGIQSLAQLKDKLAEDPHRSVLPAVQETGGGGKHLVFRHPGGSVGNKIGVLPGIDIKGDGGYIVVDPSRHASGNVYRWREGHGLLDCQPTEFPEEWLFLLDPRTGCRGVTQRTQEDPRAPKRIQEYTEIPTVLRAGRREERQPRDSLPEEEIDAVIERTLPPHKGTRHDALFALTRELVGLYGPDPRPVLDEVIAVVTRWYGRALERKLSTGAHAVDDCVERVLDAWPMVRVPGGSNPLEVAVKKARQQPDHPACCRLLAPSESTRLLLGICAHLADQDGLFFLSCGDAAQALSHALNRRYEKTHADRAFKRLICAGVLEVVHPGEPWRGGRATEYRFIARSDEQIAIHANPGDR
ncbi:MAG: bifunctional DNA primase/polymerase [Pirellulaceae bacterium]